MGFLRLGIIPLLVVGALLASMSAAGAPGDTTADRVFGQGGSFTSNACNNGGISASSLCAPQQMALDSAGNLYVADELNNRVLEYDSPLTTDTVADRVFGQGGSFTTNTCNNSGVSASSLCYPAGVAVDSAGHLYVADRLNHRVLEYDSPLTSTVADRVFGQGGSFTSDSPNNGGISATSLCAPMGLAVDSAGRLYVAESLHSGVCSNNRVLEYDSPLTSATADRVFGQGDSFTSDTCNKGDISASSLCNAVAVAVDNASRVYIVDRGNNRVLEYDSPLTTDTVADRVFGQASSFTSSACNGGGVSASSLCVPHGVGVDSAGHLYINEYQNDRVLEYDTPLTSATANRVFGQGGSFTSTACNNGGISASSVCHPQVGVIIDSAGNLYIADRGNNRVLEYDMPSPSVGGIAGFPDVQEPVPGTGEPSGGWSFPYAALAGGIAAGALALAAGGWYARRRWLG